MSTCLTTRFTGKIKTLIRWAFPGATSSHPVRIELVELYTVQSGKDVRYITPAGGPLRASTPRVGAVLSLKNEGFIVEYFNEVGKVSGGIFIVITHPSTPLGRLLEERKS